MPEPEATTTPATPVAPPVVPQSPPPPPPLPSHSHSATMIELAGRYGVRPDEATLLSPAELKSRVEEGQLLARDEAIHQLVNPKKAELTPTPAPEPRFELNLPPELKAELEELNPAMLKALEHVGGIAVKNATAKLEAELREVKAQTSGSVFAQQVAAEMNRYPEVYGVNPAPGSVEAERREATINHLAAVERQTGKQMGLDAIGHAAKRLYGAKAPGTPGSPPPPPVATPTPVARPTNRLNTSDGELNKESLIEVWAQAFREAEEAEKVGSNGSANRP